MTELKFANVRVGDPVPELKLPAISRLMLALYAGASGDHNPIHIDIDFARKSRMPDVFAHGMLSSAWLGRMLTNWVPQGSLRSFGIRFVGITQMYNQITCSGRVVKKFELNGENCVKVELQTANQYGEIKILGDAVIAFS